MPFRASSVPGLHTGSGTYPNKAESTQKKADFLRLNWIFSQSSRMYPNRCPFTRWNGPYCLGMPATSLDLKSLKALQGEPPKTQIALVRLAWPEIKLALAQGHSLRVVHQRLLEAHLPIKYGLLSQYVRRLRREEQSADQIAGVAGAKILRSVAGPRERVRTTPVHTLTPVDANQPDPNHPLADFEKRIGKVNRFNFTPGLPDESKLI